MKTASVAAAKANLSSLLAEVEAGHVVTITRRGKAVARITAAVQTAEPAPRFDFAALRAYVAAAAPGKRTGKPRGPTVAQMRERDLL